MTGDAAVGSHRSEGGLLQLAVVRVMLFDEDDDENLEMNFTLWTRKKAFECFRPLVKLHS